MEPSKAKYKTRGPQGNNSLNLPWGFFDEKYLYFNLLSMSTKVEMKDIVNLSQAR